MIGDDTVVAPACTAAVYGASGFVGREVAVALEGDGISVRPLRAPRLRCGATTLAGVSNSVDSGVVDHLARQILGVDVIVNAAGVLSGVRNQREVILGANALLPACLAAAVAAIGGEVRFIHISSAAVQGGQPRLTARGPLRPYNTYSLAKALGERSVTKYVRPETVSLRPGSVHGPRRAMTHKVMAFARSPKAMTLAPGLAPSPQVHVANVAAAVCQLASIRSTTPEVVLQPEEGFTTSGFLELMGGKAPRLAPPFLGPVVSWTRSATSSLAPRAAQQLRRIELLLRGQQQERSWLTGAGFVPPFTHTDWEEMVRRVQVEGGAG